MTTQLEQAARLALEYLEKYEYAEARTALRAALEQPTSGIKQVIHLYDNPEQSAQDEPVALETVYETIIQWDEGGGKRSRRELARRIVALYTLPQAREPLTDEQRSWIVATCVTPRQIIDLVEKMHGIKGKA